MAGRRRSAELAIGGLALLTMLRLLVAGLMPLSPDEAYYWVWSRALAAGYPDHPPMVALWIRFGCAIAGDDAFGIRMLAPLAAAIGSILLARAGDDILPGRRIGVSAAALMNATLLFGVGAVTMTPDTPLLFFWVAALWAIGRLLATGRPGWWLVAGLAVGLAMDSKYTAAFLPIGLLLWLLATQKGRAALRTPWPWGAAILALAVFSPVIGWNAAHHWVSFLKQGGRTGAWQPARAAQFLAELLGGQIGLATPILAVFFAAGLLRAMREARRGDTGWILLAALSLPAVLVFIEHALGDRVQANWPSILYPGLAIAAAGLGWRRWQIGGIALGLIVTLLVWVQGVAAPVPLPLAIDPTLLRLGGWDGISRQVADISGARFIAADNYGVSSILALRLPPQLTVLGVDPRWSSFRLPDLRVSLAGQSGLLVRSARRTDPPDPSDWARITPIGEVIRARHGVIAERFRVYRVVARDGGEPMARMPRPR